MKQYTVAWVEKKNGMQYEYRFDLSASNMANAKYIVAQEQAIRRKHSMPHMFRIAIKAGKVADYLEPGRFFIYDKPETWV